MSKKPNDADPVAQAERALAEARAALQANLQEQEQRTKAVTMLEEAMGETPDAKGAVTMGAQARVHEARIRRLVRDERGLHQAVTDAEAGLKGALAARAQAEITQQDETLDRLNGQIIEGLAAMVERIKEHEAVVSARDALAHAHDLPTPGRRRFLFAAATLRSREAELLRERLDVRHASGIQEQQADTGGPVWSIPAAA